MKRPLLSPLIAALMVGAGLILGGLMSYLPDQFPDLFKDHPVRFWGSVIGLISLLVGYAFAQAQQRTNPANIQSSTSSDQRQDAQNRQAMLEKVRATWIAGVLDPSLYKETLITLGLHARSDAVTRPIDVLVQRPHHADRVLPLDRPISQVYDDLNGAMLILGAPGAGKTTLLLELTRDLLDRASHDPRSRFRWSFPCHPGPSNAARSPIGWWTNCISATMYPLRLPRHGSMPTKSCLCSMG